MKKTLEEINNPEGERIKRLLKRAWMALAITVLHIIVWIVILYNNK